MTFRLACSLGLLLALASCGDDDRPITPTDSGTTDTAREDTGTDSGGMACTGDGDCDDGHDCTIDMCGVGGTCRHTALNERCSDGEICSPERGCTSGCVDPSDCDDGMFCNGEEQCLGGMCVPARSMPDCDDGNECTIDMCDDGIGGCLYEVAPGCDAGVIPTDGGVPDPFDPEVHYEGTFLVAPAPSLVCPGYAFDFDRIVFTNTGGTLRLTAGPFNLSTSSPSGPTFDANGTGSGCSSVRLEATFSNSDQFMGTWTHNCCSTRVITMFGQRI